MKNMEMGPTIPRWVLINWPKVPPNTSKCIYPCTKGFIGCLQSVNQFMSIHIEFNKKNIKHFGIFLPFTFFVFCYFCQWPKTICELLCSVFYIFFFILREASCLDSFLKLSQKLNKVTCNIGNLHLFFSYKHFVKTQLGNVH